jgi:hypothetical protein
LFILSTIGLLSFLLIVCTMQYSCLSLKNIPLFYKISCPSLLLIPSALQHLHLHCHINYIYRMLILILRTLISALRSHRALTLENLALRHQLEILQRNAKRPCLTNKDRTLWVILSRLWPDWRKSLMVVQPDTVIRWHKKGFKLYCALNPDSWTDANRVRPSL